ncbi:hypothetical protein Ade02nite_79530 [Paractinoplanes deccanensis]|uniref:DUF998 domain-containing protein n=1 Tax=Paractinoplanes deccanensis TaxID=113561 RepID=A0ABQ3YH45_9ACTN|nr:DUF998 domain-containing protein [Actinoplanes deccanensis]GID79312.1 hypothetical protein Ade02nite_79530 [Actinoplanes deccanensis]
MTDVRTEPADHSPAPAPVVQSRAAAAALIAGGMIFFVAELITAAAWTDPPYSYTYHFISNLGVHDRSVVFDQLMYSPLAVVMKTGFVLFGLVAFAGVVLLKGMPPLRRLGVVATAALLAVGGVLVGLFPGSAEAVADGTDTYHTLGAFAAFAGGNVLVILIGLAHRHIGISQRLGRALMALGTLGLISMVTFMAVLVSGANVLIGLFERGGVYLFLIGLIAVGATLWKHRNRTAGRGVAGGVER